MLEIRSVGVIGNGLAHGPPTGTDRVTGQPTRLG